MNKLALTLLPLLFACAAQTDTTPQASKQNAQRALATASTLLEDIDTEAAINSALPGVMASVDFSAPCPTGGSIELDGTFEMSDDGLHSKLDVTAAFLACAAESEQLDGTVRWTETVDGDDHAMTLTGTLSWQGAGGSASCTFDVTISDGTYSGTACGHDVAELDQ